MRKIVLLFVFTLSIIGCSEPQWIDIAQSYPINSSKIYINDLGRNLTPEEKNLYPTYIIFSVFPHINKKIRPSDLLFQITPSAPYEMGDNGGYITVFPQIETWERSQYTVRVSIPNISNVSGDTAKFSVVKLSTILSK